jgi:hypothetical protein
MWPGSYACGYPPIGKCPSMLKGPRTVSRCEIVQSLCQIETPSIRQFIVSNLIGIQNNERFQEAGDLLLERVIFNRWSYMTFKWTPIAFNPPRFWAFAFSSSQGSMIGRRGAGAFGLQDIATPVLVPLTQRSVPRSAIITRSVPHCLSKARFCGTRLRKPERHIKPLWRVLTPECPGTPAR